MKGLFYKTSFSCSLVSYTTKKNMAAVALGRLGGLKGGKARANIFFDY